MGEGDAEANEVDDYVLNTNTHKVHDPECPGVEDIARSNREDFHGTLAEAERMGYNLCGQCLA